MKVMKGIRSHMKWNVKMSGRFGRGKHKVNIKCRKSDKDAAPYGR
jgi:hypothetical protein